LCSNGLHSQLFSCGGIKEGKFFIHLEVPLVTPVPVLGFLCCIVTSDKIWICYFNPVLSAIILMETYQKLQEKGSQYLAVFGDGEFGGILGGTKQSCVKVPGPWYNSAYWCCLTL
jgi:hypothetical protein